MGVKAFFCIQKTNMDDRSAAKILFMGGANNKHIAKLLGRTEKTIASWRKQDGWDNQRATSMLRDQTAKETVTELIAYQLDALKKIKDSYIQDGGTQLIARGDIDALQKLFTTVRDKEMEWSHIIKIMREFAEWLKIEDLTAAQEVVVHVDKYLNYKRKSM